MDWVPVEKYGNYMEAELGRSTLAAAGIESVIAGDDVGHMYPSVAVTAARGLALLVPPEDLEEAALILSTRAEDLPSTDTPG